MIAKHAEDLDEDGSAEGGSSPADPDPNLGSDLAPEAAVWVAASGSKWGPDESQQAPTTQKVPRPPLSFQEYKVMRQVFGDGA